ncbi:hypothetical protein RFI_10946, partial [Reticulomyxa filosa]
MAQQEATKSTDNFVQLYVVTVNIIRGLDLPVADLNGSSDPYVITKIFTDEWKTKVVPKNLNPQWNESKVFCFFNAPETIEFIVNDKDEHTQDDLLGTATFHCSQQFQEIYVKAQKQKEGHQHETEESGHLTSKYEGILDIQKPKSKPKGRIQVAVSCEVLLPLDTEVRLTKMQTTYTQLNEQVARLQTDKQSLDTQIARTQHCIEETQSR